MNGNKIDNSYFLYYTQIFFRHGNQDDATRTDLQEIRSMYIRMLTRFMTNLNYMLFQLIHYTNILNIY